MAAHRSPEEYDWALKWLDNGLITLTERVPHPVVTEVHGHLAFRFEEQSYKQAVILRMARIISGLRAAYLLLHNGYLQEQASLCRMIDEFNEDVVFLCLPLLGHEETTHNQQFLGALFEEGVTSKSPKEVWHRGRNLVSRRKVRATIANATFGLGAGNPSDHTAVAALLGNAYSGYVHGAAPHTLEMYDPTEREFLTAGMKSSPFFDDHERDIDNYFARGFYSYGFAGPAFGAPDLGATARSIGDSFAGL